MSTNERADYATHQTPRAVSRVGGSRSRVERQGSGWRSWRSSRRSGRTSPSWRAGANASNRSGGQLPKTHGIVGDVARKDEIHPIAIQIASALGGLDVLINNASSLGPVPLASLADTDCEDLEQALATNLLGPFRLTKALLGSLASSAREGRGAVVVNISSDAAVNAYGGWGAYGASKAALLHMTRIWQEELGPAGVRLISFDPGDMDTPLHAAAIPDADRADPERPGNVSPRADSADRRPAGEDAGGRGRSRAQGRSMIPATAPVQRPRDARLLTVDSVRVHGARAPVTTGRPLEAVRRRDRERRRDDSCQPPRHTWAQRTRDRSQARRTRVALAVQHQPHRRRGLRRRRLP